MGKMSSVVAEQLQNLKALKISISKIISPNKKRHALIGDATQRTHDAAVGIREIAGNQYYFQFRNTKSSEGTVPHSGYIQQLRPNVSKAMLGLLACLTEEAHVLEESYTAAVKIMVKRSTREYEGM